MQLELSPDQAALLKRLAESALSDLKAEIRRTATREFHDELQLEEVELQKLIEALGKATG